MKHLVMRLSLRQVGIALFEMTFLFFVWYEFGQLSQLVLFEERNYLIWLHWKTQSGTIKIVPITSLKLDYICSIFEGDQFNIQLFGSKHFACKAQLVKPEQCVKLWCQKLPNDRKLQHKNCSFWKLDYLR